MGPQVVVVVTPGFQFLAGMGEIGEDRLVQELVPQTRIDALVEPVLIGFAWGDVVPLDVPVLAPAQDRHAGQFGAINADDRMRPRHALEDRCIELTPNPRAGDRRLRDQAHTLPAVVIDHGKDSERAPTGDGMRDEVEAPALVRFLRDCHRCPRAQCLLATATMAHLQPLLAIEPSELLVVHCLSFPAQQPVEPPVAEPASLARQLTDTLAGLRIVRATTDIANHGPVSA